MKTYTYDSVNRLVQVSNPPSGTSQSSVNLAYNGLGQRLRMDAAGVIAHYVMDTSTSASTGSAQRLSASSDRPLTAETGGNTTFYLYGLGAIGEKATEWNYSLPDGTNPSITLRAGTPRQLTDMQGEVTLLARYTPWGDSLEVHGIGNFSFGYFGGVLDATTGLLYVGNGQYGVYPERSRRDPATGRFLTREVYPNSPNPYVPWNPIGAIVGPLGLIALVFGRRKKGSKAGTFLVLAVVVVGSVGMTLAGCGGEQPAPHPLPQPTAVPSNNNAPANPTPNETPQPGPGTDSGNVPTSTPSPVVTLTLPECPTPTGTSTPKPYTEPWKRYKEYDPVSNSIPKEKWGNLDSNEWDIERSELVWKWLGESMSKWWSGTYPNAEELTAWLLWQEGGVMLSEMPGDNVYAEGGGMQGAKLMIRFMKRLFADSINSLDLARFTSFFNPNSGGAFDQGDWNELMTSPPYYPYVNTVKAFWGLEPLNEELTWWVPGEAGFNYTPILTVRHPNGNGDILYFAYK